MNRRIVRQFSGFLATPPLWKEKDMFDLPQFQFPELSSQAAIHLEIPAEINTRILGKRMEWFFEFAVNRSGSHRVLASNVQMITNKITIGEIDYLIEDRRRRKNLHVELVYKVYLYDPSVGAGASGWIGPNRKDSLLRKINKLKLQQLPLLYKEDSRESIHSLNLNVEDFEQEVCFKALLFLPVGSNKVSSGLNPGCVVGYYLNLRAFSDSKYHDFQFYAPEKQDWPVDPRYNDTWVSYREIYQQIINLHAKHLSPLIWMKSKDNWESIFVVWWQ